MGGRRLIQINDSAPKPAQHSQRLRKAVSHTVAQVVPCGCIRVKQDMRSLVDRCSQQ
jgi:hypothetical protein